MSGLVIVAASGLAAEVLAVERPRARHDYVVVLDDDPATWGSDVGGAEVVGGIEEIRRDHRSQILVCVGRGPVRRSVVARLARLGIGPERYARVVHPGVALPPGCVPGPGSIVLAGVAVTARVRIGSHVVLMPNVTLTHDDTVEDYATLAAGVSLGGGVTVGEAAYLGMNAAVREQRMVGREAVLGMGAVLLEDLPDGQTWVGVPAGAVSEPVGCRS